ncbi:Hypothetical protein CINCED_3A000015 [Cinara cedri]|uniref:Uncharacterized protein n=1 Tax=Cinara cedri TaxID=506608 RepID=A0A5E4MH64_9HEMI|nr:Hypothetical protein CINCED_3A000015 [Cinara cedri]
MLRDDQGKVYRYRNPSNRDDFKVSYVDGRETVVLLPPGVLQRSAADPTNQSSCGNRKREQPPDSKVENRENPSSAADVRNDYARVVADAVTSERPGTATPRRVIVARDFTGSDGDSERKNIAPAGQPPGPAAETAARGRADANSTADVTTTTLSPVRGPERDRSGPTDHKTVGYGTGSVPMLSLVNRAEPSECDGRTGGHPDCGGKGPRRQDCDNEKPREICDGCADDDDLTLLVENHIKFNIKLVANSRSPAVQEEHDRGRTFAPEKDNVRPSTIDCDPAKKQW